MLFAVRWARLLPSDLILFSGLPRVTMPEFREGGDELSDVSPSSRTAEAVRFEIVGNRFILLEALLTWQNPHLDPT